MPQVTSQKIKMLEEELHAVRENVERLWTVIGDEMLWRPRVIQTILKRSQDARKRYSAGTLHAADDFMASLKRSR